jgi:hypothetical protein
VLLPLIIYRHYARVASGPGNPIGETICYYLTRIPSSLSLQPIIRINNSKTVIIDEIISYMKGYKVVSQARNQDEAGKQAKLWFLAVLFTHENEDMFF